MDMNERMRQNSRAMKCKCGNTWLSEVVVAKYNGDQLVAMGQPLQPVSDKFILYSCPKCGEFLLPKVHMTTQDSVRKDYDSMYDALIEVKKEAAVVKEEAPKETEKEEKPDKTVAIPEVDIVGSKKKGKAKKGEDKG